MTATAVDVLYATDRFTDDAADEVTCGFAGRGGLGGRTVGFFGKGGLGGRGSLDDDVIDEDVGGGGGGGCSEGLGGGRNFVNGGGFLGFTVEATWFVKRSLTVGVGGEMGEEEDKEEGDGA